jgi:DNA-binding SARP family transcriptional activator
VGSGWASADADQRSAVALQLTGAFELRVCGRAVAVPHSVERVAAFLALAGRPVSRSRLAGALWCDSREPQAAKSLRTALWRLHRFAGDVVAAHDDRVALAPGVPVDVSEMIELAHRLVRRPISEEALALLPALLERGEVLPDWEDEWVVVDRERYRLLRLEALESAAAELLEQRRIADALVVVSAVVHSEPLRESARRLVVLAQLEQGNVAEAVRGYRQYASMLAREFDLAPSPAMTRLVAPLVGGGRRRDDAVTPG